MKKIVLFILVFPILIAGTGQVVITNCESKIIVKPIETNTQSDEFVAGLINERLYICKISTDKKREKKGFYDYYYIKIKKEGILDTLLRLDRTLTGKYQNGWLDKHDQKSILLLTQTDIDHPSYKIQLNKIREVGLCLKYIRYKDSIVWERQVVFPNLINSHGYPTISPDGKKIVFSIKDNKGISDLYMSTFNDSLHWDEPVRLDISDKNDDLYPSFTESGDLIFASTREGGIGGLDLYYASYNGNSFVDVIHLKYPLNSKFDDFGLVMHNSSYGFFTSNRMGSDDIYSVYLTPR